MEARAQAVKVTWISHASFRIEGDGAVVYIDPWKIAGQPKDGHVVLISHSHYDHLSPADVAKVARADALIAGPPDVITKLKKGRVLAPGGQIQSGKVAVTGVPAYNIDKQFHPKANQWLGLVVELADKRIYYAGDTDVVEEMALLGQIDLALLPVGGTYTMDAAEAAKAAASFQPQRVVPYHWGDIVGGRSDAERLAKALGDKATILTPGQSLTIP